MNFDQFEAQWLGRRIDYDHVYKFQCVDLILEGIYEMYGIASGVSGNAIDYWVKTGINGFNQNLLNKFDKIASNEPQRGDIVVLYGLPGNPDGHIGWSTGGVNATEAEILEQNGQNGDGDGGNPDTNPNDNVPLTDGNQIRTRWIARNRIAGILRPKTAGSPPVTAPTTPAPSTNTVVLPASVTSWAVYRVGSQLRKGTSDQVGALAPSRFGGLSYPIVEWVDNGDGVVIDTESYGRVAIWVKGTVAEFTTQTAAPTPPPTPVNPKPAPPAAPVQAPSSETYELIKEITGYTTSNQAANHAPITKTVQIPNGTYFIFNKRFLPDGKTLVALNITKTPGTPGAWINPDDNTNTPPSAPEPEPAAAIVPDVPPAPAEEPVPDFADTYKPFPQPQLYVAMQNLAVVDQAGVHKEALMPQYSVTWISGTFTKDGVDYARPKSAADKDWWHGIAWIDRNTNTANLELEREVFGTKTTLEERRVTHTLRLTDYVGIGIERLKNVALGFTKFFGKMKAEK